jgi:hypothetical protein
VENSEKSAYDGAKNFILESISVKRYGLWEYNSVCLQGRNEHTESEGRIRFNRQGYKNLWPELAKQIQVYKKLIFVIQNAVVC